MMHTRRNIRDVNLHDSSCDDAWKEELAKFKEKRNTGANSGH